MKNTECPVLVVGGRTTGLTMACEPARHGDPVCVIDKSPGIGAHSWVRHVNRQGFPGEEDPHQYVLADVVDDAPISRDERHGFLTGYGTLYVFLLPAPRSFVVADISAHHDSETEAPTLDDIRALVSGRGL